SIQARLFPEAPRERGWLASLAFWRGLALAASIAVLTLAALLFIPREGAPPQNYVALLADDQSRPVVYASADRTGRLLNVKALEPISVPAGKTMELWALPQQGAPRSLGIIAAEGTTRVDLPRTADATFSAVPAMAISIEPTGGSPTGLPTGPVVYK